MELEERQAKFRGCFIAICMATELITKRFWEVPGKQIEKFSKAEGDKDRGKRKKERTEKNLMKKEKNNKNKNKKRKKNKNKQNKNKKNKNKNTKYKEDKIKSKIK